MDMKYIIFPDFNEKKKVSKKDVGKEKPPLL